MNKKRILIIAAHPDDEILGCGGTISRLINEGYEGYTLILGEGVTSRYDDKNNLKLKKGKKILKNSMNEANKILGVKKVINFELSDNQFDKIPLIDIVKIIEKVKNDVEPSIVFTHYKNDLNVDHRITYKATLTATRPVVSESVKEILSFEILSSTEWNFPTNFSPNIFFDISQTLDKKIKALSCYNSELREFPHPRSIEGIKLNSKYWGMKMGLKFAEAFEIVRTIK